MCEWDYRLWRKFTALMECDTRGYDSLGYTAKMIKELNGAVKTYGVALRKIKEKYAKKEKGTEYKTGAQGCVLKVLGELGGECEKMSGVMGEIENILKTSMGEMKEEHKRIGREYDKVMGEIGKQEVLLRGSLEKYEHSVTVGRKAYLIMRDVETDKTNTVLEIERARTSYEEKAAASGRAKEECRETVGKFNEMRETAITQRLDKVLRELGSHVDRRATKEVDLLLQVVGSLRDGLDQSMGQLRDTKSVLRETDAGEVTATLRKMHVEEDPLPPAVKFEDLGSLEAGKKDNDLVAQLENQAKSIRGMRDMLDVYRSNPRMGDTRSTQQKLNYTLKEFKRGLKRLKKFDPGMHLQLKSQVLNEGGSCGSEEFGDFKAEFGEVIQDFESNEEGTLSVRKGDRVEILYADPSGWDYVSRSDGQQGHVPETFIKRE